VGVVGEEIAVDPVEVLREKPEDWRENDEASTIGTVESVAEKYSNLRAERDRFPLKPDFRWEARNLTDGLGRFGRISAEY